MSGVSWGIYAYGTDAQRDRLLYWRRACRASRCTSSRRRRRIAAGARLITLATSPKCRRRIVKQFNWYPGIDAGQVKPKLDAATAKAVCRNLAGSAGEVWQSLDRPYFDDIKRVTSRG